VHDFGILCTFSNIPEASTAESARSSQLSRPLLGQGSLPHGSGRAHTDKKENKIFLKCREIQMGSYMRKGFLIYEEMHKYFHHI
jgi:hypothetical protein